MAGWLGGWVSGWPGGWAAGWLGGWVAGWPGGWEARAPPPPPTHPLPPTDRNTPLVNPRVISQDIAIIVVQFWGETLAYAKR